MGINNDLEKALKFLEDNQHRFKPKEPEKKVDGRKEEEDPFKKHLKAIEIGKKHLQKVVENRDFNETIIQYYFRYHLWKGSNTLLNKADRMAMCNSIWQIDLFKEQKVKDFVKTSLCKDKFCNNCKKVRQAAYLGKFKPLLEPYRNQMYQVTLTIPNVCGDDLSDAIDSLLKGFARLIEYWKGKKKVKGVDFAKMGYRAAIRSLEVTIPKRDEYHPHLHAVLVFDDYTGWKKEEQKHRNRFSTSRKKKGEVRLFSDEEILLQKVWYLIINKETVNKKNIDAVPLGYSCRIDKFKEDDFPELFKYMTKSVTEQGKVITYEQFKILYEALLNRRQIQGYGEFFNLKDDDEIVTTEAVDEFYDWIRKKLEEKEKPRSVWETPSDLVEDEEHLLISRKKVHKHLREIDKKEDLENVLKKLK